MLCNKRHRSYCFTWNNYTTENIDTLTHTFSELSVKKYCFQEEIGEKNKIPHLQGVVQFNNPIYFNTLKRIDEKIHWEICKDIKGSIKYCSKPATRRPGSEPYLYMIGESDLWSSKQSSKKKMTAEIANDAMMRTMIEDVQLAADKRSKQWDLEWEYQKEWYQEMNKLFGNRERIADMPDE